MAPPARLLTLRKATFALLATILTAFGWFLALVTLLVQPRRARLAARVGALWGRAVLAVAGGHLVVQGRERLARGGLRMIVANHTSFLDPPTVLATVPGNLRFVLKKELGRLPFLGWHVKTTGHFLLDRESARAGARVLERAVQRARRHDLLPVVFPEGTRSPDGRLGPLRAGSFQIALEAGMPVQPLAILGTHEILPKGSWGPLRRGRILVRVGEPISTEGLAGSQGRKILAGRVEEALRALLA